MSLLSIFILGVVQGITEFLPISSSGHLVLFHRLLNTNLSPADELAVDIAMHIGTLFAVLLYFRREVWMLCRGGLACLQPKTNLIMERNLFLCVILASIPVIIVGLLVKDLLESPHLRSVPVIATTTLIFGLLMGLVDRFKPQDRDISQVHWKQALLIGGAQILSLIPGTSRSGITMTMARYCGFDRGSAARFSAFLGMVGIAGAGFLTVLDLVEAQNASVGMAAILAGFVSFISALITVALMMRFFKKRGSLMPFMLYRIGLAVLLIGTMIFFPTFF